MRFIGTAITLFGTLVLPSSESSKDATYTVTLDGSATTNFLSHVSQPSTVDDAATDVLVQFENLQDGAHTLQLTMHNTGDTNTDAVGNSTAGPIIAFDRAVIQTGAGRPR